MNFNYEDEYQKLLTPRIVGYLSIVHEYKGKQEFLIEDKKDIPIPDKQKHSRKIKKDKQKERKEKNLIKICETAKFESMISSNRMSGITVLNSRMKQLLPNTAMPHGDIEKDIAGYRDAWVMIHENSEYLPFTPDTILELHRTLYKYLGMINKGKFRKTDHFALTEKSKQNPSGQFLTLSYEKIPETMDRLCKSFIEGKEKGLDSLLLIPMVIMDFLRIRPFQEGNERMSLLLMLFLLANCGYKIGKYSSIEKQIETRQNLYFEALIYGRVISFEESVDYVPFTELLLSSMSSACGEFIKQAAIMENKELKKFDQVKEFIKKAEKAITAADIRKQLPNISEKTMYRSLNHFSEEKEIIKIGGGRYTSYKWNGEKN